MKILETILIISISFSLFYTVYLLLSKKERSFHALRFYLIGALIISAGLPFLHLEMLSPSQLQLFQKEAAPPAMVLTAEMNQATNSAKQTESKNWDKQDFYNLTMVAYLLVSGFFFFRLIIKLIGMMLIIIRSKSTVRDGIKIVYNTRFKNTFSFFHWVFVHQGQTNPDELQSILSHEKVHARQYHSLDLILAELFISFQWFNPLSWMMSQSIQLLHEYQADEKTLQSGITKTDYQALLINQVTEEKLVSLSSSFNQSLIKKRILMMTQRDLKTSKKKKMLFALPATLMVLLVAAMLQSFLFITEPLQAADTSNGEAITTGYSYQFNTFEEESLDNDTVKKRTVHVQIIETENTSDTVKTVTYKITEDDSEMIFVDEEGRANFSGSGFTTKETDSTDTKKVVEVRVMKKENYVHTDTKDESTVYTLDAMSSNDSSRDLLYIIDGVESDSEDALLDLEPDEIEKIEVFKGEKIKEHTDKKVEGVIKITTKQ